MVKNFFILGLQQQLRELKLNWIYFMVIASLYAISYTSISSSFHQFVTNPTVNELNHSSDSKTVSNNHLSLNCWFNTFQLLP